MDSSLFVLIFISLALVLLLMVVTKLTHPRLNKHHFQKKWEEIESESNMQMAVIKADSLLDEALRHANIKGSTMGERLNNSRGLLRDINGAWSAHKMRNRLVHETAGNSGQAEAKRALGNFKKALKDLGAL